MQLIDVTGWVGGACVLGAYLLSATGKLRPGARICCWLNFLGALGMALHTGTKGAYPSTVLNGIWALISLILLKQQYRGFNENGVTRGSFE